MTLQMEEAATPRGGRESRRSRACVRKHRQSRVAQLTTGQGTRLQRQAGPRARCVRVGGGRCQVKGAKGLELIRTARRSRRKVSNKRPARHNLSFGRPTVEWTKADGRKLGDRKTRTHRLDRGVDHTDQTREREERADEGCQAPFLADRGVTEIGNNGRKQVGSTMEIKGSGTGYSGMLAPTPAASHEPLSASLVDSSRIIQVGTFQRRH